MKLQILILLLVCALHQGFGWRKYPGPGWHKPKPRSKPNIIFIVADDMGINDIGYRNSYFHSPVMDKMAREGVIFEQNYNHPICTASRNSYMTGLYDFKTGLQLIFDNRPQCVPFNVTLLPERMKENGYATHMVGKWHLGFCNLNCTPTYRGFDSFYGFYNGFTDHFDHTENGFLDLRDNETPVTTENGTYSTHLFTREAVKVIDNHDTSKPLFMYLAHPAPHSPIQAPQEYIDRCGQIPNCQDQHACDERRVFCGMVAALDEGIENVTKALKNKGIFDNTIIFFTSDNGGPVNHAANNWPLRGSKATVWEGGTRSVAFVHSPLLKKTGIKQNGLFHAVDYFSTIVALGGGNPNKLYRVDGIDQRRFALKGRRSKRYSFVYNIDNTVFPVTPGRAAIRFHKWKLVQDVPGFAFNHSWYPAPETTGDLSHPVIDQANLPDTFLFNVEKDPREFKNLASKMPRFTKLMERRLNRYKAQAVPALFPPPNPASNPENFGGIWSPGWC